MYAVIESGGKQYRVAVGDRVKVESLRAEPGTEVQLEKVLLVCDGEKTDVGTPYTGAVVAATVVEHGRGPKVRIVKFRRRQNSRRHAGHRQNYTELQIIGIGVGAPEGAGTAKAAEKADMGPAAAEPVEAPAAGARAGEAVAGQAAEKGYTPAAKSGEAAPTGDDSDLTQLTGVGPVLAEKLHTAGVTSLSQIAGWTEDDIARIDEALGVKARIERDDWVGQAKTLTKKSG